MTAIAATSASEPSVVASNVVVKCVGLTKNFKDFWMRNRVRAVDNIDLEIRKGELFGLLGPNGSGKSTTIKMLLGLLHPTAGRIAVFGKLPEDVATKKNIGYLPEESYLYRFLNARETLDYYGRLFHQSRPQRMRRIDMLLEMVGLDAVQRRPVGEYSKGMQRRIGLAQALINDPQFLILDEPTTGMDPIGTRQIKDLLLELRRRGKTILLCSHLLADVEDVCDRVSIMYGGKVRAEGTVDELLVRGDMTTLQTDALDDATLDEIRQVLQRHGKQLGQVDRPRQKLESLFLDIVARAQAEGVATAGAHARGQIAAFLTGMEGQPTAAPAEVGEEVIDHLVHAPRPPEPAAAVAAREAPEASAAAAAQRDLINDLVQPEPASPAPQAASTAPRPVAPAPKRQEHADQSLIDSLIQPQQPDDKA
ncbi:MAG: ABC transporter ATP-binding protein [Phycisphaeraceae bacterium]|nr:ABC transporter ATP-binding protein [Phycisphaeraceae bacterium]